MEVIQFVAVEEMDGARRGDFETLAEYEKEHPLHRLYEYIMQYFGGVREDVLNLLCDRKEMRCLAEIMGDSQDAGLRNEWYRRLQRLLLCNAEADWYRLFYISSDKKRGYQQYFHNQIAGYAEMGVPVQIVKKLFYECDAAYLLEYKVRQLKKNMSENHQEEIHTEEQEEGTVETNESVEAKNFDIEAIVQKVLSPILEGQNKILNIMEAFSNSTVKEKYDEVDLFQEDVEKHVEEVFSDSLEALTGEQSESKLPVKNKEDDDKRRMEEEWNKENSFRIAKLFQQIRIKRKSVKMRKMDHKQQLMELIHLMQNFEPEALGIVRSLIEKEVSLEFLYTIIAEEKEPVKRLKQMHEFLSYPHEAVTDKEEEETTDV